MVKELKKLIAQKELISSQITKEINKIKIDAYNIYSFSNMLVYRYIFFFFQHATSTT